MSKFKGYIEPLSEDHYIDIFTNPYFINYFNDINEVFNKSADVTIDRSMSGFFSTKFKIDSNKYEFMAKIEDKIAIIIFYSLDGDIDLFKERKNNKGYLGILFGSIIQSVQLMLKEKDINQIGFTADYKSLEKIYDLLDKTIQKRFPDWKLYDKIRNKQGKLNYVYIRK